jgi:RNA polymerase sporulation-specific sigma factor
MSRLEELIRESQQGSEEAKETLVKENTGLIWSVAKRFAGRGVEMDDLYQLGCLGFIKAVDGFDASFGTQFSTYAVPKISGEIRRFLRDDGAVKVSRSVKERAMTIKTTRNLLIHALGREPTIQEISAQTGYSMEDIAIAESATAVVESIQDDSSAEGFSLECVLSDTQSEDALLEQIALRHAIIHLSEQEGTVIRLRYYHAMTQDRIAKVLGVSQVQVSRIEKRALEHLRQMLR